MRKVFFRAVRVGLHIHTDTDWQIVVGLSVAFETVLAYAYLVNDIKRKARMSVCTYGEHDETVAATI